MQTLECAAALRAAAAKLDDLTSLDASPAVWLLALNDASGALGGAARACAKGPNAPPVPPFLLLAAASAVGAGLVDRLELPHLARELRAAANKAERRLGEEAATS